MSDYVTLKNAFNDISTNNLIDNDRVVLSNNQENKLQTSDYHVVTDYSDGFYKTQEAYIEQNIKVGCEIHKALTLEFGDAGTKLFQKYCANSMRGGEVTVSDMKKLFTEAEELEKSLVENSIRDNFRNFVIGKK